MARDIRALALQKIASLSAAGSSSADRSDLDRLCRACHAAGKARDYSYGVRSQGGSLGKVPMSIREFEVLLALCKTAPSVQPGQSAQRLSYQLTPYMLEAPVQTFAHSPFFRQMEPSPTETLTFHVTAALLSLGLNYADLQETVLDSIWAFLNTCTKAVDVVISAPAEDGDLEDAVRTTTIVIALLGFLEAAAAQTDFWRAAGRLALVQKVRHLLSERFLVAVETALSTIRNSHSHGREVKEWKRIVRHYAHSGRPLGAMLLQRNFMRLVVSSTSLMVADVTDLRKTHILDLHMARNSKLQGDSLSGPDADTQSVEVLAGLAAEQMDYIEAGADFVSMGTPSQQKLAYDTKGAALIAFLNCAFIDENAADSETLLSWLQETIEDPAQMADDGLAAVVLKSLALVCHVSPSFTPAVSRLVPQFLVQSAPQGETSSVASECLAFILNLLSKDSIISTLYSLGNALSPESEPLNNGQSNGDDSEQSLDSVYAGHQSTGSSMSLKLSADDEGAVVYENILQAVFAISAAAQDEKITALAVSMLLQKLGKISPSADDQILIGAANLALDSSPLEFRSLLKMFTKTCLTGLTEQKDHLSMAATKARIHISTHLKRDSPLFDIYLEHLLETIISFGDDPPSGHTKEIDVQLAARKIAQLLRPLGVFMAQNDLAANPIESDEMAQLLRDSWFNIVVHGFTPSTENGKKYMDDLRRIAVHSPPLVSEQRSEQVESDIELNTVLRRGNSHEREAAQKKQLVELIPAKAADIKGLSYRKVIFLQAAYLVESLRSDVGDCTKVLPYFLEPSMHKSDVSSVMEGIAGTIIEKYLRKTLGGNDMAFSAQYAAKQLASIFCSCCHRIERVQEAAFTCADRIIRDVPSALCSRTSLFALLELLSLMWTGCLEAETDMYSPRSVFESKLGKVRVELSDDYEFRRWTLDILTRKARVWVHTAINLAPLDVKGLLQTYLSEFGDDGAYGHIYLGRSFALEMGSVIPSTDHRLQSLQPVGEAGVNTASDLIAQYTTRQEYRYGEALPDRSHNLTNLIQGGGAGGRASMQLALKESANASTALAHVEARILSKKATPFNEIRDILRRAAALLCRSESNESAVARYLVSIPFALFTKESIKLGVSLWLGVIHENPLLEPKLVNEIAQQWELTITRRVGLFNPALAHPDPFFLKEEFAPSELEAMSKQRQMVHDMLSPHTRLLQFFTSHFNATRLGSLDTRRSFLRMLDVTLSAMRDAAPHPMARELRLQILLFGLRVLRWSTMISSTAQWRLKDNILSAGLGWFRNSPKWSFGSNLLQLKTEIRLMSDVLLALQMVNLIGGGGVGPATKSLQAKEQLLQLLLESEQIRLSVWANPLNGPLSQQLSVPTTPKSSMEAALAPLVRTAWALDPAIAVELVTRFQSARLHKDVRFLLMTMPEKAISLPEALPIIFAGGQLPSDATPMLKYLLYWAPVNPVSAVTMFSPAYKHHPLILQFAMRALESHPVDVTFFYVPQIVQTLRYDALGYVKRYILETAQFSQLFAHQIIWNMKANSYKDDDAQVPDEIKPTLDTVMGSMVDSFAAEDRSFYEREFAFFDEVTSISGKLRPIKDRPKDEKKQKIEEELRRINVDVGVYLPSNPEGSVIGIDRTSGKPLQSHAKCPFMATFRIKKTKTADQIKLIREAKAQNGVSGSSDNSNDGDQDDEYTVETWQSAIFKVGDDCRQDVLALQMIAAFRGIFHNVGLDVYVFPYRVTATGPGCGVIDVLPNSISRDMLGREAVNKLYDYFVSKYGNENSLRFQRARANFVKSMAAYSVISFLLQFKDRHNGNIMIDDAGHILHIDFGFCFDIAPGGIKFERAPFKLTQEMLAVMGGSTDHQSFKWFEELCVKAFLAARQYCDKLCHMVQLMMDSGLPCFKPESVTHFRQRFVLDKTDREAAEFMKFLIRKSYSSYSTGIYDQFQLMTNGIPY
ncbi:phosphatidylinositol 4-kinase A [Geosmithia morbida]|uniref:1-phosphatidylinositol 4-kinase n=1 Tax=Geosmithia morbida TaxID=1094350 RepID=A0A9P4YUX0_9HYPO|nr:phosphatidylinositol 4-kinase A [Geosmithia morbida]KAF4122500.1 phosphatidylinositol 4-kinase A [Geosmithia morbida]